MLRDLAKSGKAQGEMVIALAGETTEQHATAMRLQRMLAHECRAMALRQERLTVELAAAQHSILELRSSMPAAPLMVGCKPANGKDMKHGCYMTSVKI